MEMYPVLLICGNVLNLGAIFVPREPFSQEVFRFLLCFIRHVVKRFTFDKLKFLDFELIAFGCG